MAIHSTATAAVSANSPQRREYVGRAWQLTNDARRRYGRKPLQFDPELAAAAARQSAWMARRKHVGHHPKSLLARVGRSGYKAKRLHENVMGPTGDSGAGAALCTPEGAIEAWLRSPGHRKNLLARDVEDIGLAYDRGYWTQIMGKKRDW